MILDKPELREGFWRWFYIVTLVYQESDFITILEALRFPELQNCGNDSGGASLPRITEKKEKQGNLLLSHLYISY
jgi:hypothetical protein